MTEQDLELGLTKDSEESGTDLWSEEEATSPDIPKISSEESPKDLEVLPVPSNLTDSLERTYQVQLPRTSNAWNVWTNEDRYKACVAFVIHGHVPTVAKLTGFPLRTVYGWVQSNWWPAMLDKAKREHQDLIESRFSDIVEKATVEIIDRIQYGDYHYDPKKGSTVRVPLKAKDLNQMISNLTDRLRTIRNQPNKLTAEIKFDPVKAAREFAAIAAENRSKIVSDQ